MAVGTVLGATIGRIVGEFEQGGVTLDRTTVAAMAAKAIEGRYTGISLERAQLMVNDILNTMKPMAGVDSFDTASQVRFLDEAAAKDGAVDFRVGDLTPGLAEAITMMRPGGKYRVTIPSSQAYGEEGIPGIIPGRAALQFIVELIAVKK